MASILIPSMSGGDQGALPGGIPLGGNSGTSATTNNGRIVPGGASKFASCRIAVIKVVTWVMLEYYQTNGGGTPTAGPKVQAFRTYGNTVDQDADNSFDEWQGAVYTTSSPHSFQECLVLPPGEFSLKVNNMDTFAANDLYCWLWYVGDDGFVTETA